MAVGSLKSEASGAQKNPLAAKLLDVAEGLQHAEKDALGHRGTVSECRLGLRNHMVNCLLHLSFRSRTGMKVQVLQKNITITYIQFCCIGCVYHILSYTCILWSFARAETLRHRAQENARAPGPQPLGARPALGSTDAGVQYFMAVKPSR